MQLVCALQFFTFAKTLFSFCVGVAFLHYDYGAYRAASDGSQLLCSGHQCNSGQGNFTQTYQTLKFDDKIINFLIQSLSFILLKFGTMIMYHVRPDKQLF